MERIENTQTGTTATRSNLSDWSGPPILSLATPNEAICVGQDQVVADHASLTDRLYDILYPTTGSSTMQVPGGPIISALNVLQIFNTSLPLKAMKQLYTGLSYDEIHVTITLSDPKGLGGGIFVGYYPWRNWFGLPVNELGEAFGYNRMMTQNLINTSPESHLMCLSQSSDVKFTIPWQFNVPWISFASLALMVDTDGYSCPIVGSPILWVNLADTVYVTSVHSPATMRMFASFKGLRFVGPTDVGHDTESLKTLPANYIPQSGEPEERDPDRNYGRDPMAYPEFEVTAEYLTTLKELRLQHERQVILQGVERLSQFVKDMETTHKFLSTCCPPEALGSISRIFFFDEGPRLIKTLTDIYLSMRMIYMQAGFDETQIALIDNVFDTSKATLTALVRTYRDDFEPQSGLEIAAAGAAASLVVDTVVSAGSEIFSSIAGIGAGDALDGSNAESTYQNPDSVQLAYVGDSTSTGPPPTTPVFTSWITNPALNHPILDYLKRPQYIGSYLATNTEYAFWANPTFPTTPCSGDNQHCTYFRWFSQACSYWRGTIVFDIVILGHPMIQMEFTALIRYPPSASYDTGYLMEDTNILKGTFSGVKCIRIPMPFLWLGAHVPILDAIGSRTETDLVNLRELCSPSKLLFNAKTINTMLDVTPNIPFHVYMSAGNDFRFMQPFAVGLNNVDNVSEELIKSLDRTLFEPQIGIPPPTDTFETRSRVCEDTVTLPEMVNVEDWMQIWSRSLPYGSYDSGDEPIPEFAWGALSLIHI